jgi:hypothetical protein
MVRWIPAPARAVTEVLGMRFPLMLGWCVTVAAVALAAAAGDAGVGTRADADALQQKLIQIATNGLAAAPAARSTAVSEREVNAFLRAHGQDGLPAGVIDPLVTILPDGKLEGRATVDLDQVRASKQRGMMSPWTLLRGRLPVEAIGTLRSGEGVAAFSLESASVGGVPVPKSVLQEVVGYYTTSPQNPDGVNFEAPFRLPAHIREIRTALGTATIVQ